MIKMHSSALRVMALLGLVGLSLGLVSCQTQSPSWRNMSPVQHIQNGVQLHTATLNVKVQFYADDRVRVVKWAPGGTSQRRAWSWFKRTCRI